MLSITANRYSGTTKYTKGKNMTTSTASTNGAARATINPTANTPLKAHQAFPIPSTILDMPVMMTMVIGLV